MPAALKKLLKILAVALTAAVSLYVAATLALGFWGYPAQSLPAGCPNAGRLVQSAQMPVPVLSGPAGSAQASCPLVTIAVLSNGAHTDFLLPAQIPFSANNAQPELTWPEVFPVPPPLASDAPDLYAYIGWGQREFYLNTPTWADVRLPLLLRAAVGATAALHVEYAAAPNLAGLDPDYVMVQLTLPEYAALARFILEYAQLGPDGRAVRISVPGYGPYDAFYEANGIFSALKTCNTWTAQGLAAAGQAAPYWTNLAWFVLHHLR